LCATFDVHRTSGKAPERMESGFFAVLLLGWSATDEVYG
jgi:hypothetical protein